MGRSAIYLIIGFSAIMLITGKNMSTVAVTALDNSLDYYENTQRYALATAAANFACSKIWENQAWSAGYDSIEYNGGYFTVSVTTVAGTKEIYAWGNFNSELQTVRIKLRPSSYSDFAYYGGTSASAAAWETGDTIGGPSHTEGKLKTFGSPVFMGKATSKTGLTKSGSPATPDFRAGFESGISIGWPGISSYDAIITAATDSGYMQTNGELYLKFKADGTVDWKTSAAASYTNTTLTTFAPNGVIAIDKGQLFVEGTLDGRITLASLRTGGSTGGTTRITNSLVMKDNPRGNPSSNDMLGIVSYGNITIADNSATQFDVQGTLYSYTGGLFVENGTSRPAGTLSVYGGMSVEKLYATSNGASGSARKGYNLSLWFDNRFANDSPDYFPSTGTYHIVSWLE